MDTEVKDPNDWLEQISCDLGLRQFLDEDLRREQNEYKRSGKVPSWYPSDLGKDLFLRFVKRKGAKATPHSNRTLRKFEIGKLWEARIHAAVDKKIALGEGRILEIDFHPDAEFETGKKRMEDNDLELRGYYDRMLLVNDPKLGWLIVVYEIKSVSSDLFHKQKIDGEQPLGNRKQMMFYLHEIRKDWDRMVSICQEKYNITPVMAVGVLSQVSKDDASIWERTYEYDPIMYASIKQEIDHLNSFWKTDRFPEKHDLIILENGSAKIYWEYKPQFCNYVEYILGRNHENIIKQATTLVNQYNYLKKHNAARKDLTAQKIREFNKSIKGMSRKELRNDDYELAYGMDHILGLFVQVFERDKSDDGDGEEKIVVDLDKESDPTLSVEKIISIAEDYGFDIRHELPQKDIE